MLKGRARLLAMFAGRNPMARFWLGLSRTLDGAVLARACAVLLRSERRFARILSVPPAVPFSANGKWVVLANPSYRRGTGPRLLVRSGNLFGLRQDHRHSLELADSAATDHGRNLPRELAAKVPTLPQHGDDHRRAASRQYPWLWASLTFCQRSGITPAVMNIVPIIPIRRREAFDNPAFLLELKYDGFRALADTVNGRMLSKNANRMRRFEKLLRRLPAGFGTPAPSAVQSHALDVARTSRAAHRLKASPQPG
jgi:hypothetical protein